MHRLIAQAIASHQLVQLDYNGSTRIVEPHIYGIDTRGHETLSAYQVVGGSLSGEHTGWKTFEMAKAGGVQLLAARFRKPRREYNPADPKFHTIYRRL
jgi:hypothetical protein